MDALGRQDPTRVGPYRLLGRLGRGGMGQVYLGVDPEGSRVAVKVVHDGLAGSPVFRRRFEHEVAAARRVRSRYTVEVLAADPAADRPWMATAFVDAPTLREVVAGRGPLGTAETLYLAEGLAVALQAIHRAGIVHRDLKPANVLLASDGPKVIDFGIARSAEASTVTGTGQVAGSAGFMSPEQVLGDPVGPPSDVFSLGALLHFAATGDRLFGDGALPAVLYRIAHDEPDLAALTDDRLRGLVRACLAKDPAGRPSADGVAAVARGELPVPPPGGPAATGPSSSAVPVHARRDRRRSRTVRAAVAGGAVAGVLLAAGTAAVLTGAVPGIGRSAGTARELARGDRPGADGGAGGVAGLPSASGPAVPSGSGAAGPSPSGTGRPVLPPPAVAAPQAGPGSGRTTGPASGPATGPPGSRTTAPSRPPSSPSRPPSGPSPGGGPSSPAAVPFAALDLTAPPGLTATAYFGRLAAVTGELGPEVTFQVPAAFAAAYPDRCALTVVFRRVGGSTAAVYAVSLGSGWTGAENVPDQSVATDGGVVHQQLVAPPPTDPTGTSYQGAGRLEVDGAAFTSGSYTLTRMTTGSAGVDWAFGSHRIRCSTA